MRTKYHFRFLAACDWQKLFKCPLDYDLWVLQKNGGKQSEMALLHFRSPRPQRNAWIGENVQPWAGVSYNARPSNKAVGLSWLTRVSWVRNWLESLFLTLSQLESAYLQRYLHFGYHIFIFGIPEWEVGRRRKQENKWFVSSQKWYMLKCQ